MYNINLIGYRGCGKTVVGLKLAEVLQRPFVDSDALIVERIKVSIAEFVKNSGWERFRQLETELLKDCCQLDKVVLATGGGVVLDPENRTLLKNSGTSFWLQVTPETTLKRISEDPESSHSRPPLSSLAFNDEILQGLLEREPLYREVADFIIPVERKSIDEIVQEIVTIITREFKLSFGGENE